MPCAEMIELKISRLLFCAKGVKTAKLQIIQCSAIISYTEGIIRFFYDIDFYMVVISI